MRVVDYQALLLGKAPRHQPIEEDEQESYYYNLSSAQDDFGGGDKDDDPHAGPAAGAAGQR